MSSIQVSLSDEQTESLKDYIFTITKESIEQAQNNAKLDKKFLKQKYAAEWLGISVNKLKDLEKQGLPTIIIDGLKLYSKDDISNWILQHQK